MPRKKTDDTDSSFIRSRVISEAKKGELGSTVVRSTVLSGGEAVEPKPARKTARTSSRTATTKRSSKKKAASAANDTTTSTE